MASNTHLQRKRTMFKSPGETEADLQKLLYQKRLDEKKELLEKEFRKEIMQKSLDQESGGSSEATVTNSK